jgi:predicted transcriptional regulator
MSEISTPTYQKLRKYMNENKINNIEICKILDWSPAGISNYLSGKSGKDTKLDMIVELYLENINLKKNFNNNKEMDELMLKYNKSEAQVVALKELFQSFTSASTFNIAELLEKFKQMIIEVDEEDKEILRNRLFQAQTQLNEALNKIKELETSNKIRG